MASRGYGLFGGVLGLLLAVAIYVPVRAQTPRFDVASIKALAGPPNAIHGVDSFVKPGGRFIASEITLNGLVSFAYDLKQPSVELVNAPPWSSSDFFEIQAESAPDQAELSPEENREHIRLMLQSLLAERFHFTAHRETRSLPDYDLTVAKGGVKMKSVAAPASSPQGGAGGSLRPDGAQFQGSAASVSAIVGMLSAVLRRPVVDKTNLAGNYDFILTWTTGEVASPLGGQLPADYTAGIFSALERQLGLRLTASTGPVEVLVIDSVQKPDPDH